MGNGNPGPQPTHRPSIFFLHMTSKRVPAWMIRLRFEFFGGQVTLSIRIIRRRRIFRESRHTWQEKRKNRFDQTGLLCQKSLIFSNVIAKLRLDNKAAIRYLNSSCWYHNENCRWVSGPTTYWNLSGDSTQPKICPYFDFKKGILIK